MKILRITACNIASLAGPHTVDFTREPLRSAGLFSISGPTGAGKSSLLDAMCLALYDRTPRLASLGQLDPLEDGQRPNDPQSLLRRGTASGYAEVVFAGIDQTVRTARWSVRRSRNRIDGKLRPTDMVLFRGNVPDGTPGSIEAGGRKTEVLSAIRERIGLTFEQFTRAVLLAQNDFAVFLKSGDRERAEILQALTGTERFETLSRMVFERAAEERRKLDDLNAQRSAATVLTPEERTLLAQETELRRKKLTAFREQAAGAERLIAWLHELQQRNQALDTARQQVNRAEEAVRASAATADELRRTEIALDEAWNTAESVRRFRQQVDSARRRIQAEELLVSENTTADRIAAQSEQKAADDLRRARQHKDQLQPLLIRAGELDGQLAALNEELEKNRQLAALKSRQLLNARSERDKAEDSCGTLMTRIEDLRAQLRRTAFAEPFEAESSLWTSRLEKATQLAFDHQQAVAASRECESSLTEATEAESETRKQQQELDRQLQLLREQNTADETAAAASSTTAIESELSAVETQLDESRRRQDLLRTTLSFLREEARLTETISTLTEQQRLRADQLHQLSETEIPLATRAADEARRQVGLIESAVSDTATLLREQLQPDHPCPVCGAVDHPYAEHAPFAEPTALRIARTELHQAEQKLHELSVRRDTLLSLHTNDAKQLKALHAEEKQLDEKKADINSADVAGSSVAELQQELQQLEIQQSDFRQAADSCRAWLAERRRIERVREERVRQMEETIQQATALRERAEQLTGKRMLAESEREAGRRRVSEIEISLQNSNAELSPLWAASAELQTQFAAAPKKTHAEFSNLLRSRIESAAQIRELQNELKVAREKFELQLRTLKEAEAAEEEARRVVSECESQIESRRQERLKLFDGRACAEVLAEADRAVKDAESTQHQSTAVRQQAAKALSAAGKALELARVEDRKAQGQLSEYHNKLTEWRTEFSRRCGTEISEHALQEMLSRDQAWLEKHRNQVQEARDQLKKAQGELSVRKASVEEHTATQPEELNALIRQTFGETETTLTAAAEPLKSSLQEQIGSLAEEQTEAERVFEETRDRLRDDDRARRETGRLAKETELQRQRSEPWLKLNDLIGSADGAKFRRIAQQYTLDILLDYTNAQLCQLSGRYRLSRLPRSLNLTVTDHFMGDERRSVHSLSGGESFLVSLALALGLASLTSNRLRIESLFIDEGFGSLDPETLNTAMTALMQLEAQGRKVGVISHVTEMTDAIPVQIRVVRARNGASRIVVPGADALPQTDVATTHSNSDGANTSATTDSVQGSVDTAQLAARLLNRLIQDRQDGHDKSSVRRLRQDLGCSLSEFRRAQEMIADQIEITGRSLRLK